MPDTIDLINDAAEAYKAGDAETARDLLNRAERQRDANRYTDRIRQGLTALDALAPAVRETAAPPALAKAVTALRRPIDNRHIRWRPAGKDKEGNLLPDVPYLAWQDVADLLDERLAGLWRTETVRVESKDMGNGAAAAIVTVRLTIGDAATGTIASREATAWHRSPHSNAPSVEVAERRALVRCATLFGLRVPDDAEPPNRRSRNRNNNRRDDSGGGSNDTICPDCGEYKRPQYPVCYNCNQARRR